jgi:hypothetical protein
LTVSVNENRATAALVHSIYPGDEDRCLRSWRTDADGVGLASNIGGKTEEGRVTDVDIIIARGEIPTGGKTHCDIIEALGVAEERTSTGGRVLGADGVTSERLPTDGRILDAEVVEVGDETGKSPIPLSGVGAVIASVRRR